MNECVSLMGHADRWEMVEMDSLADVSGAGLIKTHPSPSMRSKTQGRRIREPSFKVSSNREGGWFLPWFVDKYFL